jgi:hypothetical protein
MTENDVKNDIKKDRYKIDLTKIPEIKKDEPIYKYQARLQRYLIYYKKRKKRY